ncbi:MAG TPA: TetR/AcrR family transcriptional regulator [Vineibacter sp.]|nr:TetR/AcrR family transcriptional regulator [Vineibacter sp.]
MSELEVTRLRTGGSGRLPAEEAARLPDRLLDAATAMFLAHGYAKASMEAIARAAGASTKTIYSRYRNKDEILAATIRRMVDRTLPPLLEELENDADTTEPRTLLATIAARLVTLVTTEDVLGIFRLVIAESPRFPELSRLSTEGPGRAIGFLGRLFERWHRSGQLRVAPTPDKLLARLFFDMTVTTPRNRAAVGRPLSRAELDVHVAAAVDLFWRAYGVDEGSAGRRRTNARR